IPLGGNRRGPVRRYINLLITMLLCGLWHGAGWRFGAWGGLHGLYLVVIHVWRGLRGRLGARGHLSRASAVAGWMLTMLAVVVGWVFFRSETFSGGVRVLKEMAGMNGIALPNAIAARVEALVPQFGDLGWSTFYGGGTDFLKAYLWIAMLTIVSIALPNTQQ